MQPLADLRVLAITGFLAGPFLGMTLARLGAEVIKIERPGTGDPIRNAGPFAGPEGTHANRRSTDDISTRFLKRNQGVKSVTLDLKNPRGQELFLGMAKEAQVVIENLAPGSMKRLGLGYEDVSGINPSIVYCSISGYGQSGPYSDKRAHDPQIQGMSGLMDINGYPDRPPTRVGFYIGDLVTPLYASYAILAALREQERTGKGAFLDVSMMDALMSLIAVENLEDDIEKGLPLRMGNQTRAGPTGLYHAKDGDVIITVASDDQWRGLATALKKLEWLKDSRFESFHARNTNVDEARSEIQGAVESLTRADAIEKLEQSDVPCAPVRTVPEAFDDRHFWNRGTLQEMFHGAMDRPVEGIGTGFPVLFDGKAPPQPAGAPTLGMHNQQVFADLLNLDDETLATLSADGVI